MVPLLMVRLDGETHRPLGLAEIVKFRPQITAAKDTLLCAVKRRLTHLLALFRTIRLPTTALQIRLSLPLTVSFFFDGQL